jgi:hypothetical protein
VDGMDDGRKMEGRLTLAIHQKYPMVVKILPMKVPRKARPFSPRLKSWISMTRAS